MKKWSLIPAVAALVFLSSADSGSSQGVQVGAKAPDIALAKSGSVFSLDDMAGKYVLLNFWSVTDPASRIANIRLDRMSDSLAAEGIEVISICGDTESDLYSQILIVDSLDLERQYHYSDSKLPTIMEDYSLESAPAMYLIGPDGMVVAEGKEPDELLALV